MLNRILSRVKHVVLPSPSRTKEECAAAFFVNNFKSLSKPEMNALVKHYWTDYRRFDELTKRMGMSTGDPDLHLLDIGGGFSTGLRLFETRYRWVLDICVEELYKAGMDMPKDIRFIRGHGERIPFPDDFFDCVYCTNVLDHVEEPGRVLAETKRVLRPNAYFIVMIDLFDEGHEHSEHDILHPHTYHADNIESELETEFHIVERTTQPSKGKVGIGMLARNEVVPHPDRQEHIFVLQPKK